MTAHLREEKQESITVDGTVDRFYRTTLLYRYKFERERYGLSFPCTRHQSRCTTRSARPQCSLRHVPYHEGEPTGNTSCLDSTAELLLGWSSKPPVWTPRLSKILVGWQSKPPV